ncbi:hypothetical protein GUA87_07250 [Sneathiella sp. P13V-1]|uniref:hypothetical protein n=1 Tax=Sneathiella sp. P13V-1 TaxID=2697366 RepID=UPI00187B3579|nr:hypothetical protein [Sneathiella sp. P13V-1]MBE7636638.1 hypothetical protein [Sneathiella sp. P13V-1]
MSKPLIKIGFMLLCGFSLNSCANIALEQAETARTEIVGMAKSELFECAGLPDQESTDERGREYVAYKAENIAHILPPYPGPGFYPSVRVGPNRSWGIGGFYHYPVTIPKQQSCKATFTLENDKVVSLSYRTNDQSEGSRALCAELIKSCLKTPSPTPQ